MSVIYCYISECRPVTCLRYDMSCSHVWLCFSSSDILSLAQETWSLALVKMGLLDIQI